MSMNVRHRISKIFQPSTVISKTSNLTRPDVSSKSQRLMLELGIIQQANPGCFHFLPLGLKSFNKLVKIVDRAMFNIGGQKVLFPTLINSKMWKRSGRLEAAGPELFQLNDRHKNRYILSPTHEEAASDLLSAIGPISYKNFPLRLYQISSKFRDEIKPKFGLMRCREFIMKDMYSFDVDVESSIKTYEGVCDSYEKIFRSLNVNIVKVLGSSGTMGGNLSHEYHIKAPIGEDNLLSCNKCDYLANVELCQNQMCPNCGEDSKINIQNGIEVGHTFLLGDKYSRSLEANFISSSGELKPFQMGSYGLGLSRILAASIEVLSSETEMRWPDSLAPFNVVIIPPKAGSKEDAATKNFAETLYDQLEVQIHQLQDNVLLDDRSSLTLGRRLIDAKRVGYRFVIIINKRTLEPVPLYELNDLKKDVQLLLNETALIDYIRQNLL
ncbi:unnamed protein product [Phaedon cochleariae]|uniref:Probable proline--tRNA ligase, mitochondrial n=1 Tax=Phaedon cochleariae TaxID=80249 RepID=A0A9N9SG38_PHACE|nr:unnamed protein product [Phaedon cochleariae]